jgi:Transketolase-like TK C-terminal domain
MSDTRQNLQMKLDFRTEAKGEAPKPGPEATESLRAASEPESPASTDRLMEVVCERVRPPSSKACVPSLHCSRWRKGLELGVCSCWDLEPYCVKRWLPPNFSKEIGISQRMFGASPVSQNCRSGLEIERWNRYNPTEEPRRTWIEHCLSSTRGPVIAASDYVRAVPDLIRTWIPRRYVTLGTDGFGRSDTRAALRRFFEVDYASIALAAITALAKEGAVNKALVSQFMARCVYQPTSSPSWVDIRRT